METVVNYRGQRTGAVVLVLCLCAVGQDTLGDQTFDAALIGDAPTLLEFSDDSTALVAFECGLDVLVPAASACLHQATEKVAFEFDLQIRSLLRNQVAASAVFEAPERGVWVIDARNLAARGIAVLELAAVERMLRYHPASRVAFVTVLLPERVLEDE